jgi:C-terminal processing protease CtpA/Prc
LIGSAADKCGQLSIGDQIVQIDETRFEDLHETQAVELLKRISQLRRLAITTITIKLFNSQKLIAEQ